MADLVLRLVAGDGSIVPVRYRDNGDGTYSMAVAFTGPGGSGTFEITDGTFILGTVAHPLQVSYATQLQYAQDSITVYGAAAAGAPVTGLPVAVAGVDDANNAQYVKATTHGRVVTTPKCATGTTSSSTVGGTNSTLLAANTLRLGATIFNEGTLVLYVKCGAVASVTDYTRQIASGGYWEVPYGYTGRLDAISTGASAIARVTEFTN